MVEYIEQWKRALAAIGRDKMRAEEFYQNVYRDRNVHVQLVGGCYGRPSAAMLILEGTPPQEAILVYGAMDFGIEVSGKKAGSPTALLSTLEMHIRRNNKFERFHAPYDRNVSKKKAELATRTAWLLAQDMYLRQEQGLYCDQCLHEYECQVKSTDLAWCSGVKARRTEPKSKLA